MDDRKCEDRAQFVAFVAAITAIERSDKDSFISDVDAKEFVVEARRIIKAAYESEGLDFDNPPE